jgi:NAD(P)H-flavin reductase
MDEIAGKVASIVWQADNTFYMTVSLEKELAFEPGKFINLTYKGVTRSYTCCNHKPGKILEMFIRLKEGGKMSALFEKMKAGDSVKVSGLFSEVDLSPKNIICIGGGSGAAAFISTARAVEEGLVKKNMVLFVSSRRLIETAYPGELARMKKVKTVVTLTREQVQGFESGRITPDLIRKYVDPKGYSIFVCGPQDFTTALGECLKEFSPKLMSW